MKKKSVFDLEENVVAALSYILGPISGIFVLVMERENKFVRFHALQSTLWFLLLTIIGWVLHLVIGIFSWIPIINWIVGAALGVILGIGSLIYFGSKIFLIFKAYTGATCKIPVIGDVAWTQISK
jgi:uncharacterized membrane protein